MNLRLRHRILMFIMGVVLIIAILAMISVLQAQPIPACAPHDEMVGQLADQYGERNDGMGQIAKGLHPRARLLELFVSNSGSWTILVTDQNRLTCMIASGERWQGKNDREARR